MGHMPFALGWQTANRALQAIVTLSGPTMELFSLDDVGKRLNAEFDALRACCRTCSNCGCPKPPVVLQTYDAAQAFERIPVGSVLHAWRKIRDDFERVCASDSVTVTTGDTFKFCVGKMRTELPTVEISLGEVENAIIGALGLGIVQFGPLSFRTPGVPTGGKLSRNLLAVYLTVAERSAMSNPCHPIGGGDMRGIRYVDDIMTASSKLCSTCAQDTIHCLHHGLFSLENSPGVLPGSIQWLDLELIAVDNRISMWLKSHNRQYTLVRTRQRAKTTTPEWPGKLPMQFAALVGTVHQKMLRSMNIEMPVSGQILHGLEVVVELLLIRYPVALLHKVLCALRPSPAAFGLQALFRCLAFPIEANPSSAMSDRDRGRKGGGDHYQRSNSGGPRTKGGGKNTDYNTDYYHTHFRSPGFQPSARRWISQTDFDEWMEHKSKLQAQQEEEKQEKIALRFASALSTKFDALERALTPPGERAAGSSPRNAPCTPSLPTMSTMHTAGTSPMTMPMFASPGMPSPTSGSMSTGPQTMSMTRPGPPHSMSMSCFPPPPPETGAWVSSPPRQPTDDEMHHFLQAQGLVAIPRGDATWVRTRSVSYEDAVPGTMGASRGSASRFPGDQGGAGTEDGLQGQRRPSLVAKMQEALDRHREEDLREDREEDALEPEDEAAAKEMHERAGKLAIPRTRVRRKRPLPVEGDTADDRIPGPTKGSKFNMSRATFDRIQECLDDSSHRRLIRRLFKDLVRDTEMVEAERFVEAATKTMRTNENIAKELSVFIRDEIVRATGKDPVAVKIKFPYATRVAQLCDCLLQQ